ncbi:hypothetical protein JY651_03285 [Pyxidicoccus parkwayensis]|uniref:Lipoprotein n=1 Tax=Pyxidicoccus parkwayensis TaxID=2813578 RepID=A0ABX7P1Q8_9BACT|nr:hypothetical protein [Pyxidicoccus parkwaysis]QSQ24016.1 hypothetical protein JY651_03285 [Pyxidicoccus parkwaysis]
MRNYSSLIFTFALGAAACGGQGPVDEGAVSGEGLATREQAAYSGVNGTYCIASPYNCKLQESGGNRVPTNDPADDNWGITTGIPIRDGNGTVVGTNTRTSAAFNYGQTRTFANELHAFAVSTSNSSAGWLPISAILGRTSFEQKVGHVSALGAGLAKLGCYAVRNWHDPALEVKKVVYDSTSSNERAGDYLPLVRANGLRSVNLIFNVPGFALGGPAVDHFPAGTKFQRLDVPTDDGPPSIDIPLWVQNSAGRYVVQSGTMKFIYGYVIAATGTKRNGWMAYDALEVSSGCP